MSRAFRPHVRQQRWIVFVAALVGTALLATGFALAIDRAVSFTAPAPRLTTVPPNAVSRAGYTLSAPVIPPYCGAEQAAAQHGWVAGGSAGCPISREQAEHLTSDTVVESVLARVTGTQGGVVGQDRLMWLLVSRPNLQVMFLCVGAAVSPYCPPGTTSVTATQAVLLMDAYSGRMVDVIPVNGRANPPIRIVPVPTGPPIKPPVVLPIPRPSPVVTDGPAGS